MTAAPELNVRTGELRLAEGTFSALVAHATGADGGPGAGDQLQLLREAEALDAHGRPHDALFPALAVIREPQLGRVELSYQGKAARGWVDSDGVSLLLPAAADGRCLLTHLPVSLLPGGLAKLVDLGPRPRPEPAAPVRYTGDAFTGVRRHWRLTVVGPANGNAANGNAPDAGTLEVVDTDGGMWVLQHDESGDVIAWPGTPTTVWRRIVALTPGGAHPQHDASRG